MRRIVILCFAVICSILTASAQVSTTSISGRVVSGEDPVEGAVVIAINTQTGFQYSSETDSRGYYYLIDITVGGPYTVRFASFGSNSVTVRGVATYAFQNLVIDVDLSDGSSYVHTDTAASVSVFGTQNIEGLSMSIGQPLTSKAAMVPQDTEYDVYGFWPEPMSQISFTQTPYDVRQSGDLLSSTTSLTTRYGSNSLHGVVYDYYTDGSLNNAGLSNMMGLSLSGPLFSEDILAYGTLDYSNAQLSGYGRLDWRAGDNAFLNFGYAGMNGNSLFSGEMTNRISQGRASNDLSAIYYGGADGMTYGSLADSYTTTHYASKYTFGAQVDYLAQLDTATTFRTDFYAQDEISIARRFKLTMGLRMGYPFTFSPRLSFYYDILGNSSVVLRGGSAVYDRSDGPASWKLSFGLDKSLPNKFKASIDWLYGQYWNRMFYISTRNILDDYFYVTGKLERPLSNGFSAIAAYTRSNKFSRDRVVTGLSYTCNYSQFTSTGVSFSYRGATPIESEVVGQWQNALEWRASQIFYFNAAGVRHSVNLTFYQSLSSGKNMNLIIFRYSF